MNQDPTDWVDDLTSFEALKRGWLLQIPFSQVNHCMLLNRNFGIRRLLTGILSEFTQPDYRCKLGYLTRS